MSDMEEASKRWIEEGRAFKTALNAWLAEIYAGNKPSTDEPEDTRDDMADQVLQYARQLTKEGRADDLRRMFPPSHEPFDYDEIDPHGVQSEQLLLLKDGRVVATVYTDEGRKTYVMRDNEIEEVPGVIGIARSTYHEHVVKAYEDRLDVHASWDGPVVRTLAWPKGYGDVFPKAETTFERASDMGSIATLSIFPDGKRAVVATESGVFLMSESGSQLLHPSREDLEERIEDPTDIDISLSYPHTAISPDGSIIAVGVQEPPHVLLGEKDGVWVRTAEIYPRSSYPHAALFHDAKPHVALAGCHFANSATIGLQLDKLPKPGGEPLTLDGYSGDEDLDYIDDRFWVFSIAPLDEGYALGANNGYIWAHAFDGRKQLWFCHLGSTLTAMDISEDRNTLVVGTYSGQVIKLRLDQERDLGQLITDRDIREERRWVFWPGGPMAW